jgi:hypothetical protein
MGTPRVGSGEYKYNTKLVAPNLADALVRGWVTELSDFAGQGFAAAKKALFGFASRLDQYEDAFAQPQLANLLAGEILLCRPLPVRSTAWSQRAQTALSYGTTRGAYS